MTTCRQVQQCTWASDGTLGHTWTQGCLFSTHVLLRSMASLARKLAFGASWTNGTGHAHLLWSMALCMAGMPWMVQCRVLLLHCAEVDGVAEHLWTGGCPPTVCLFRRGGCSFVRSLARSSSVFQTACRINLRTKHACPRVRTYGRRWQHLSLIHI